MRALLLLAALLPLAAAESFAVDPAGSRIVFHCSTTWHDFDGSAPVESGALTLDGERSHGAVAVAVAAMTTGKAGRDEKMQGEVLAAAAHPRIVFTLAGWEPGAEGGTAHGTWTMHGASQPIDVPVAIADGHARAAFTLDVTRWGIVPPSIVVNRMAKEVRVEVDLRLVPSP